MPVTKPSVQIRQSFQSAPASVTQPLRPFIFGPEYALRRYIGGAESERSAGIPYNPLTGNAITWTSLGKAADSVVDLAYSRLFIEKGSLEYYRNTGGIYTGFALGSPTGYSGDADGSFVFATSGFPHRIQVTGVNLSGSDAFPLSANLFGRPVTAGDTVVLSNTISSVTTRHVAKVTGLLADQLASSIATASVDANNAATRVASVSAITQGGTPAVSTITVVGTNYDGTTSGFLSDTYTVRVRNGSLGTDARTAVLDITSASGTDNVSGITFATTLFTTTFNLGTRGATATFVMNADINLFTGSTWTVTVGQAFTAVVAASNTGPNYSGTTDTTYVLTVVTGGNVSTGIRPVLSVATTNGADGGQAITVLAPATTYPVGTLGVTASFTGGAPLRFRRGDQFYISATAAGPGPVRTILIDQPVPVALRSTTGQNIDLTLSLGIPVTKEINPSTNFAANWSDDITGYNVAAGISLFDAAWRSGVVAIPILDGTLRTHWRELVRTNASDTNTIDSLAGLSSSFTTPVDSDNPLVFALSLALTNSGGAAVQYMAVPTDDLAGYQTVLARAETRENVYALSPLSQNSAILDAVAGHCVSMSTPERGRERIAVVSAASPSPSNILRVSPTTGVNLGVTSAGNFVSTATPGVDFLVAGVRVGDVIRVRIGPDSNGLPTFESYTVSNILSSVQLQTLTPITPALGIAQIAEIWRGLTADQEAAIVAAASSRFSNRRVVNVYPDALSSGGRLVPGHFAAAAVAGLIGGSAPQQGLSNTAIFGFDNVDKVSRRFSESQLDTIANGGTFILDQDTPGAAIYVRQELTTNIADLNTQTLMVVKNVDSISKYTRAVVKKYVGRANVTPSLVNVIRTDIEGAIAFLRSAGYSPTLGGQLIDGRVTSIRQSPLFKDRIEVETSITIPYPLNTLVITLVI